MIGLPANLFYNTSIPTCIVVLKKHRGGRDVLFIDASQKYEKGKKQNAMTDEHIDSVIELYNDRKTVDKEAYLANFEDIEKNDFNLNIPRYVDNFEKEAPSVQGYFMDSLTGTTIKNLGLKAIREMIMFIPQDVDEQKRIGKFFDYFDHLITLHQRKCAELQNIKKYMLQNMFE